MLRILCQITSLISINPERPSNPENLRLKAYILLKISFYSKVKITRFEKTSFEFTGRNASQNKTSIS